MSACFHHSLHRLSPDVCDIPSPFGTGTDGLALLLVADEDGAVYCTAGNR